MKTLSLLLAAIVFASCSVVSTNAQWGSVIGLQLVKSTTGAFVANIDNSTVIYLNNTTPSYTVLAVTNAGPNRTVPGVRFRWNMASLVRIDKTSPYTMCAGTFAKCTFITAGTHTLTAGVVNATTPLLTVKFTLMSGFPPPTLPTPPRGADTKAPTKSPTKAPLKLPTKSPTRGPTKRPTKRPTKAPTKSPTKRPTKEPTKAPTTRAPTTASPVTRSPITAAPVTAAPVTAAPVTAAPVTAAPVASLAPALVPVTAAPVTAAPVTPAPVTAAPVTAAPVTAAPVTKAPVTTAPVTKAPILITKSPITMAPVTAAPQTGAPVTSAPVTAAPVTAAPVTAAPVTAAPIASLAPALVPVTKAPVTAAPVTAAPVTAAPVTAAPVTAAPVTKAPILVTQSPISMAPVTAAPVTKAPVTAAPVTAAPVTAAPVTAAPVTAAPVASLAPALVPVTKAPVTAAPVTAAPVTAAPVTAAPVTAAPVTSAPATKAPRTTSEPTLAPALIPTTKAPLTAAPATKAPALLVPSKAPISNFDPVLINCGSATPYTDTRGRVWSADRFFTAGFTFDSNVAIAGTDDDALYNCERYGHSDYAIPVPVSGGTYAVTLHFAEIYHTNQARRVFDVSVEGQLIHDVDIVKLAGGAFTAYTRTIVVSVLPGDSTLNIRFLDNAPMIDYPKISAIEVNAHTGSAFPTLAPTAAPIVVLPPSGFQPILINSGGKAYTDKLGKVWMADQLFSGGQTFATNQPIANTPDYEVFHTTRWGSFKYEVPVPAGVYEIVLFFAEIYFTTEGSRVFDVSVESSLLKGIDVVKLAGGAFTAVNKTVVTPVSDGVLTIQLSDVPNANYPAIGAVEIHRLGDIQPTVAPTLAPKTPAPTKAPVIAVPTPAPVKPLFEPILINCGGDAYADRQHRLWLADVYADGGQRYVTGQNILGTLDDELYQSHRYGQYNYKIPVPIAGSYEVILHTAEIYYQEAGKRVFDVNIEGTRIEDIDLVKQNNGTAFTAMQISATVNVVDGFVTIKLLDNVPLIDFPTLGAIEINRVGEVPPAMAPAPVAPAPFQTILICSGGVEYTDTQGRVWMADKFFDGGNVYFDGAKAISGTADDPIYQGERWGSFTYEIPIPVGDYVVILHFAEIYFDKRGDRIFDVTVEGKQMNDIDLVQYGGGVPNKAITREMPVSIVDGFLSLAFIKNDPIASEPKLSGIEVKLIGVHYSHAVTGGPYIAVDTDGNGSELVKVDASESHTHGPGQTLQTFTWKEGKVVLGTGEKTTLQLPVGKHDVTLTVVDSSGDANIDVTTITVKPDGYPDIDSLSPASGDVAGGIPVTIKGNAFSSATEVKFGLTTLSGSDITIVDAKTIIVMAPLSTIGVPVAVTVVTPFGASNSIPYTYINSTPIAFNINKLLEFAFPTAVAFGPDGKLYVGNTKGELGRFTLNDSYDAVVSSVIATVGDGTRGIHGIAFDPMETAELGNNINVYIATSMIFHKEPRNSFGLGINGKIQTVKGANLDIVTNIITGLPVSELDHSINGIYFGDNGELYIGVGSNTNGGLPGALSASQTMTENFFSAAILVANMAKPNFDGFIQYDAPNNGSPVAGFGPAGVEVFGAGTRNPYGVWKHSNGNVYATDNGPNPGFGAMSTGCGVGQQIPDAYEFDELNIIKRGGYYGHPNYKRAETDPRQCVWRPASSFSEEGDGYTEPMLKLASSTDGIIEFESDHFKGQLRGDLILSKYKDGLYRVILSDDGQTVNPISKPAIAMVGDDGLAVTQAPDGSMVDARYETKSCYTFQPDEPPSTELDVKSVFPRRGGLAGGSKLMIFGANFSGTPIVTIGGNACTNVVLVSAKKLECILPPGILGRADVVVTIGAASDTFTKGYRYITGLPL